MRFSMRSDAKRIGKVRSAVKADLYLFFADGNNTLTLATGSTVGRGCWGRSSSSRRGSGANPLAIFESLADLINGVVLLTQLADQVASRRLLGLSNLGSVPGEWRR
jgi:hypothetical protein